LLLPLNIILPFNTVTLQSGRLRWVVICLLLSLLIPRLVSALDLPFLGTADIKFEIKILTDNQLSLSDDQRQRLTSQLRSELERQREINLTLRETEDLGRKVRTEARILERKLRSLGYYQNNVNGVLTQVRAPSPKTSGRPDEDDNEFHKQEQKTDQKAIYTVNTGPVYLVDAVSIQLDAGIDTSRLPILPVKPGQPLRAEHVYLAIELLKNHIATNYCYYDINIDYRAAVSHTSHLASVTFKMKNSEQVKIGNVSIEGLETVDPEFLSRKLILKKGSCFKAAAVDKGRLELLRSNLLARVATRYSQPTRGVVDIVYEVQERHHRTVSAGVGYSTDEDFNVSTGWEHRNILGKSEKLNVDARVSKRTASLAGGLDFPDFFTDDLSLNLHGEGQLVDRNTYESKSVEAGAKLSYRFHPKLTFSVGSQVKYSDVKDGLSETEFYLISFPLQATWDTTNSLLDPTKGWVLFTEVSPYTDIVNANTEFIKFTLSGSAYHTFGSSKSSTVAIRFATGTISGETTPNIPADERFYVGGGGSVRGYPYQSLSRETLNENDELIRIGGSSFQELSAEIRFRVNDDWGFVAFTDGGYAFGESSPDLNEKLLWSAGFGVRYYTLLAPLRLDIAFPLDRRSSDDGYQIYINLGQAF
jgi:translocation and assembly module TamA